MAPGGGNSIRHAFWLSLCFTAAFGRRGQLPANWTIDESSWLAGGDDLSAWLSIEPLPHHDNPALTIKADLKGDYRHDPEAHEPHGHGHADPHGHGHDAHDGHGHGHGQAEGTHSVAVCLLSGILLSPMVLHMALSKNVLSYLTLRLVDNSISIFIAILWCEVFRQTIKTFDLREMYPTAVDVVCIGQIFALYALAVLVIFFLRKSEVAINTVGSCAGHFIAFVGMEGVRQIARRITQVVDDHWLIARYLLGFTISLVVCKTLFAIVLDKALAVLLGPQKEMLEEVREVIDEMEMDITGLVTSFQLTQIMRFLMVGKGAMQEHAHVHHPEWARELMLLWAIGPLILLVFAIPKLHHGVRQHREAKKIVQFIKILLVMLAAWGNLLWGQWLFFEAVYKDHGMFAHLLFAVLVSIIGNDLLVMMASMLNYSRSESCMTKLEYFMEMSPEIAGDLIDSLQKAAIVSVTAISMVVAWSWEHCFLMAFDSVGVHYSVGYEGLIPKLVLAIAAPFTMLPTYVCHIKPRVLALHKKYTADDIFDIEEEGEEDEVEGEHAHGELQRSKTT